MFWTQSPTEVSAQIGGFVLAHTALVASQLAAGELVCPYSVVEHGGSREVFDYEADSQDEAIERGKADFERLKSTSDAWAFAREGLFSDATSTEKKDVLLISAWAKGMTDWLNIIQKFNPTSSGRFELVGQPMIFLDGHELTGKQHAKLVTAMNKGIKKRDVPWSSWQAHDA